MKDVPDDPAGRRRAGRALALGATLALVALTAVPRVPAALPPLMLWAWERPTDLRELPAAAGVAFLSQTIHLRTGAITIEPRRQPLQVSDTAVVMAVTRIEVPPSHPLSVSDGDLTRVATAIAGTATWPRVHGVQVDFDATVSQRDLYRRLLRQVRQQLGPGVFLSMTALGSWCTNDDWLDGLPVDEVVPMLFRMGAGERLPARLRAGACRAALGTALDEPLPRAFAAPRVYVFNAGPWSAPTIAEASRRANR